MRILHAYASLFLAVGAAFRSPLVQALTAVCLLLALIQALVFMLIERWGFVDAFYFSVVSMATVGYGDLTPKTSLGKICAIAFLLVGIGVFVLTVTSIAQVIMRNLALTEDADSDLAGPRWKRK